MKKGFTLIELLVVIGIMAVIAAGVVALIDPVEKTRQANDANVQNAIGQIATALQSSAAQNPSGNYPQPGAFPDLLLPLVTNGELTALPALPSGYAYGYAVDANPAVVAAASIRLFSKKYVSKCTAPALPWWFFRTTNGKACGTCLVAAPGIGDACGASPPW